MEEISEPLPACCTRKAFMGRVFSAAALLNAVGLPLPRTAGAADAVNALPKNVAGAWYVDDQCIDCDLCHETAPKNFKRDASGGYSYVFKQPSTKEELKKCEEALAGCPVEAIGKDRKVAKKL